MGVPKFFRYTSERYPCLNELVKQYQIPDFDNMYLDMNGIIHNCSHPDDSNPHFRITEERIFEDIFHYLSILFQIIKPKKLFFMAIDGVAPRAKMNQQRGRRFRAAREAEKLEEEAKAKGETLPTEKRFDSNCITPGTVFMARLHEQLKYFIKKKMSTDPLWSKVKVILSGHETPGEGEHKIMDYIRWARSQPDYDPNTRHCLYGLDADLIMLGMCTHEPHFALLREEVKFGKTTQRATSPEETNFYLLHLSLLREYLAQEFIVIKDKLPFEYDIEKIVDDWVLMGFLVGNDFIPNLPNMHISNDALPILYKTYMDVLPTLDGYINEGGDLNLRRFETFMQELAKIDKEKFQDTYADLKYFEAKTGRRPNANERKEYKPNNDETFGASLADITAGRPDDELQALIDATHDMFIEDLEDVGDDEFDTETSDDEANFNMEFRLHKKDYYMNKLDYSKVTEEVLASQAEGYVRAIQWNLYYYYRGCASWCWYYPHHYAPYISDIKGFADLKIEFELGEPFKPFEQLLAVLPAASKNLLPTPFHSLMLDEDSPIVHYYPINFETDLNGKKNDWEAVVLIPFIDEANLLSAMAPCYERLTDEERRRNAPGPMLLYNWTSSSLGPALAPEYFPPIADCHAVETAIWRRELEVPLARLKRGMLPNAKRDMLFPGFPTMRHLQYKTELKKCKVKVFDQPSRSENMIVQIVRGAEEEPLLESLAQNILGKVIWVGWPHLTKAKVVSISNERLRLHAGGGGGGGAEPNHGNLHKQWISERSTIIEHNMNRLGIELGNVTTIVHAVNLKGYKYIIQDDTKMVHEPVWCAIPCGYAYQAVVTDVKAHIMETANKFSTVQEAYPTGDVLFLLTQGQYYGAQAKVVDSSSLRSGRIKVQVLERAQPAPRAAPPAEPYKPANHAAAHIGITPQLLSRVTGSVLVVPGPRNDAPTEGQSKINIGCNLKFNKKNLEVAGYTRRCPLSTAWLYSSRCVALVSAYVRQFPELFGALARSQGNDVFFEGDLWPGEVGKGKPQEIQNWLKSQPHQTAVKRQCGSEALEPEELKVLATSIDEQLEDMKGQEKVVTLHVKWNLLYKAELHEGNTAPDPNADFKLYDRVVCVAKNITVPMGAEGTITAIYKVSATNTVRLSDKLNAEDTYQVLFDRPLAGGLREEGVEEPRFYRMPPAFLLNISYGRKLRGAGGAGGAGGAAPRYNTPSFSNTPTLLRRDGNNSAFANYSPTSERQTPLSAAPAAASSPLVEDSGTILLKNLLKISEAESGGGRPAARERANWRTDKDISTKQPLMQSKPQPANWRTESVPPLANKPLPPPQALEWTNKNYKPHQTSIPPFPSFAQTFQQPLAQIPLPPVNDPRHHGNQNASFAPRNHGNQDAFFAARNHGNQDASFAARNHGNAAGSSQYQNGQFPKTLPFVGGTVMAPHGWNGPNQTPQEPIQILKKASSSASADKLGNPFVPLQVQASQRRTQNPVGPSNTRKEATNQTYNTADHHPPQTSGGQKTNQQQNNQRPQRKKKPRIAANLPFNMD